MTTTKSPRLISTVLIVLSVLMLFLGWIGVKGDYKDIIVEPVKMGIETLDEEIKNFEDSYYGWMGLEKSDLKKLRSFMGILKDGALSPMEMASVAPTISYINDLTEEYGDLFGAGSFAELAEISVVLWILAILTWAALALGIITALGHFLGSKRGVGVLYGICITILFLAYLIMGVATSSEMDGAMGATFWPWACVLLAAATLFTDKAPKAAPVAGAAPVTPVAAPAAPGWTCPGCGAALAAGTAFCTTCGTKKPEAARCINCGAELRPGAAFCTACGTKQTQE